MPVNKNKLEYWNTTGDHTFWIFKDITCCAEIINLHLQEHG